MSKSCNSVDTAKNSRNISAPVKNYMWTTSGNRCAFPDCRVHLVESGNEKDGPVTIGRFAHIFAHSKHGPRPNPDGFSEKTNAYENLILLCSNHHILVDGQTNTYSVQVLQGWKTEHEAWFLNLLVTREFDSEILDSMVSWLAKHSIHKPTEDVTITALDEKIELNGLSPIVREHIRKGQSRLGEVRRYVKNRTRETHDFPERLLTPLIDRYRILKAEDHRSDLIFSSLVRFACSNSEDSSRMTAALVLVVYFFERCEIFEK